MKPILSITNCSTSETIEREMTDQEYEQYLINVKEVTPTPVSEG